MQSDWQRIVDWVVVNAPELLDFLEPPAQRADLAEAETRLAMRLPSALRSFYGLQNGTAAFGVFPALEEEQTAFGPLPLDEIEFLEVDDDSDADADQEFEVDSGVRPEFWNLNWIPFAAASDRADYLMLDMAPARGGRVGQVIEWRHDTNERRLVAPSLEALLRQTADGLDAGRIVYDGEAGLRRTDPN